MTTLGEAFIEVHADTKPFAREIAPQLKTILDAVGKQGNAKARVAGKKISEGLDDGINSKFPLLRRRFSTLGRWIDNLRDKIDKRGGLRQAFERLAKGNFILTRLFGEFALAVGSVFKIIGKLGKGLFDIISGLDMILQGVIGLAVEGFKTLVGVGGDFAKVQSTLALGFTKIGTALAAAAAELVAAAPAIVAMIVVIAALGTVLGALFLALTVAIAPFAALVNLALLLPSALGVLLAVIVPLVVAMHGLGDALGLVFEKDPKKFAEGLKKLSPVMRELVTTLRPFVKAFNNLRDQVQKAFFTPILQQLGPTLNAVMGKLTEGLSAVAGALGDMVAQILKVIADPAFIGLIQDFLFTVADFIRTNSGVFVQLIKVLGAVSQAALPVVEKLLAKFGDFLVQFGSWIMGAITDGRFENWLKIGIAALQSIWGLVKALIGLFVALFGSIQEGGRDFLAILTRAINKFTAWVKSPEGQKALQNMVLLAKGIAKAFEIALGWVISMVNKLSKVIDFLKWIDSHTGGILSKVASGAVGALGKFSGGGVVPNDQIAMVHKGEPILDPANSVGKNRAILAQAGMLDVLEPQAPVFNVYIGNEQLDARTDYRIAKANRVTARTLATGPRT